MSVGRVSIISVIYGNTYIERFSAEFTPCGNTTEDVILSMVNSDDSKVEVLVESLR